MRRSLSLCLIAGASSIPPAIVRGASDSVHVASSRYQLGAPFDVTIDFAGRDPMGEARLAAVVREFIAEYPTKRDYWEIANRGLARRLRAEFPAGTAFSATFSIEPDAIYPARRVSRVDVDAAGAETEWFDFEFAAPLSKRLHLLRASYQYRTGCPPGAIPDYRFVQQELLVFGALHDLGSPSGRRLAASYLLARFPALLQLRVSLDRGETAWLGESERQPGVGALEADGDCRVQRRYPEEEVVFAPAECCGGVRLPERPHRRYVTPPLAMGSGGAAYEAEMRCVAEGFASGIVLPEECSARAAEHGLVGGDRMDIVWRGDFVTNAMARRGLAQPVECGVPSGWLPTYRAADLPGIGLSGAPLAAMMPEWLADRLARLDREIERTPERLDRRLVLFRTPAP